jgi:NAD-dependent DNA ligase
MTPAAAAAKRGRGSSSGSTRAEKPESTGAGKSSGSSGSKAVLEGLSVCITGVIADERFVNRQAVGDYITSLGGEFRNSVNKSTSWLVVSTRVGTRGVEVEGTTYRRWYHTMSVYTARQCWRVCLCVSLV